MDSESSSVKIFLDGHFHIILFSLNFLPLVQYWYLLIWLITAFLFSLQEISSNNCLKNYQIRKIM